MLRAFSMTDVGMKRQLNQDYVFTSKKPVGSLPNLFMVADGMGGHKAGDFASKFTVETIVQDISKSSSQDTVTILEKAIAKANTLICEKSRALEELQGMGTTLVVATVIDRCLYVANVGDSRLYIIDDDIRQVTRDHSLVEEMIRIGELDRETARVHPDKNIITRAIGAADEVKVDFFEIELGKKDVILMCSDGLSNMLGDEDIRMILKAHKSVADKAEELIMEANRNGGKDNIAVVIIEPFASEVEEC